MTGRRLFLWAGFWLWGSGALTAGAKPVVLTWYDPVLRFSKGEEVVYEIREARRMGGRPREQPLVAIDATGADPRRPRMMMVDDEGIGEEGPAQWVTHSKVQVAFRIVDVDLEKREYTVGPVVPTEFGKVKLHAQTIFDTVSQLLPGGPVPPFDPHMKKRGLVMSPPPPPGPPEPIRISDKGELIEREKITGKPGQLIGEVRFTAQVAGDAMYELEPCVRLTGLIVRIQDGALSSVEWIELIYSPDRGCVREATFERGYQRTTYYYVSSKAASPRPSAPGVTPWFPPLPERVRLLLSDESREPSPMLQDQEALNALRGAVPVEPGWYSGVLPAVRRRAAPPTVGDRTILAQFRQQLEDWDGGLSFEVPTGLTLLPHGAETVRRVISAWCAQASLPPLRWASVERFTLAPAVVTSGSEVKLTVDPEVRDVWLEREQEVIALRSRGPLESPDEALMGLTPSARWTVDGPYRLQPALAVKAEAMEAASGSVWITLQPGAPSNVFLMEGSDGRRFFTLGVHSVSPGVCHLLLSGWDPSTRGWVFEDRWIGGVAIEPGANRQTAVHTVIDRAKSTLVLWWSCGMVMCVDARTGDLLWTRTWTPDGRTEDVPSQPVVTERVVGLWHPSARRFEAFDRYSGARLWERDFPEGTMWWGMNAHAVQVVSAAGGEGYHPRTGERRWRVEWPSTAGPLSGQGAVLTDAGLVPLGFSWVMVESRSGLQRIVATRNAATFGRVLAPDGDPKGWWWLTADALERFLPQTP